MKKKTCRQCKETYTPKAKANNSVYCSVKCRNKYTYHNYTKKWQQEHNKEKQNAMYNKDNAIKCEVCGRYFKQVGTHVVNSHGYASAREYREEFGFDLKKGQLPEEYRKHKRDVQHKKCIEDNLITKGAEFRFKKGDEGVGVYKRSEQTMKRLRENSGKGWGKRKSL